MADNANPLSLIEQAKKLAAFQAVDDHVKDGQVVGIGSGSTVVYAVERIGQRVRDEGLNLVCIPTSFQAKNLIISNKLQLTELDVHFPIDVTIDGCDECDKDLNLIKGGGGCLLQEKIVASASKKLVIIADYTKDSTYLGEKWKKGVPLEISRIGLRVVKNKLNTFGKDVMMTDTDVAQLRLAVKKMGPVVTDNDNFIIDFQIAELFQPEKLEPSYMEKFLKTIPGVLETGLFLGMASQVYFGMQDGTVKTQKVERKQLVY